MTEDNNTDSNNLSCNFCSKNRNEVNKLIAGPNVYICNECIELSYKILDEDFTEEQIYKFLTKKYGEWILYDPQFNKNTYFLWILPLLIFLFGGAIIFKKINKH